MSSPPPLSLGTKIALIGMSFTIASQLGLLVWWGGGLSNRVDVLEARAREDRQSAKEAAGRAAEKLEAAEKAVIKLDATLRALLEK